MTRHRLSLAAALAFALTLATALTPAQAANIKLEADLGQSVVHTEKTDRIYLRLSLTAIAARAKERRTPVNVALVLDRSGSMQGDRIAGAKQAASMALDRLASDDVVSLVSYNHEVDIMRPAAKLGSHQELKRLINGLKADGRTALFAGVSEGARQVRKTLEDNKVNRVILMSDGLANVGPSTPKELADLGRELGSAGISVTTIGLGLDYNEDLMQRLAAASDGNHAFVEKPEDLTRIFNAEFGDALSVAAKDVTITIECKLGFKPKRVLGREGEISGNRITLKLNQLQDANERYVVVEIEAPRGAKPGEADVAEIDIDYLDLDSNARSKADTLVRAKVSASESEAEGSINKSVMSQVAAQIATETSEKAVEMRDKGDLEGAKKALEDNATYINRSKSAYGSGAAPAPSASIGTLDDLEKKSREAAGNLDDQNWGKTRKSMRSEQHKSKVQQSY